MSIPLGNLSLKQSSTDTMCHAQLAEEVEGVQDGEVGIILRPDDEFGSGEMGLGK